MNTTKRSLQLQDILVDRWLSGGFNELASDICHSPTDIRIMFELNSHPDPKIAWRSTYIIDMLHDLDNNLLADYIPIIIKKLPNETNHSIKRHYARILTQYDLSKLADGHLIDACFNWLQSEEIPIAVKAHCMLILFKLCKAYPDLKQELILVLEDLIPYGSKGVVNRARKLIKDLYENK